MDELTLLKFDICETHCSMCGISFYKKILFLRECGHSFCIDCVHVVFYQHIVKMATGIRMDCSYCLKES